MSLEAYQREVSDAMQCDCRIPVLYFTQLMGHAFGLSSEELALHDSLTAVEPLLARKVAHV
jgi:heterodisulfide reductase subunit B